MKTVSTVSPRYPPRITCRLWLTHFWGKLCATSTVGVAACGYALARPHYHIDSQRTNSQARVAAENLLCAARAAPEPESIEPSLSPAVPFALNRPSTARRWLRRMSESLTSSSGSPSSLISSSTGSSSQSRPRSSTNFQPCSRFSGRNKLVKRSLSQRRPSTGYANSTLDSTSFDHARRPFTAVNHSQLSAQRPWSRIGRSSTSERIPSSFSPSASEATVVWRPFFPTKHQSKGHRLSAPKSSKLSTVRRIFLENVRGRRCGPTLVSATAIRECCDNDTSSICSDSGSVYMLAEPDSGYYTREILVRGWHQPATSVTPTSSRSSIRRSFSLSTFLSSTPSQRNSYQAAERNDGGLVNTLPGIHSINIGLGRRYSSPIEYSMSPYGRYMRAPTPTIDEEREPLPPIQSLSMLELQPELGNAFLTDTEDWLGHNLSTFQPTASASENTNTFHQNRLSLMSASERASTLIGSESEHDYGSETVFDSMRTRISELTPVRVEDIFDIEEIPTKRVVERAQEQSSYSSAIPAAAYRTFASTRVEDDNDSWNSDWDAPSKSTDEEGCRLSGFGGLRPYSGLLSASHLGLHSHSNTSSTSFGTAPEAYSTDGASTRETNSILDWNDGVSTTPTPSCFNFQRPKTVHAKESVLVPTRAGRRAPSYHVRSQSVPVTNNLRGRVPLASENWDDDFLDDNGDGIGFVSEMVIPRAIEERQESVIGHLGCVREFALLVEGWFPLYYYWILVNNCRSQGSTNACVLQEPQTRLTPVALG